MASSFDEFFGVTVWTRIHSCTGDQNKIEFCLILYLFFSKYVYEHFSIKKIRRSELNFRNNVSLIISFMMFGSWCLYGYSLNPKKYNFNRPTVFQASVGSIILIHLSSIASQWFFKSRSNPFLKPINTLKRNVDKTPSSRKRHVKNGPFRARTCDLYIHTSSTISTRIGSKGSR